jgi:hypothetical protein
MNLNAGKKWWVGIGVTVAIGIVPILIPLLSPNQKQLAFAVTKWSLDSLTEKLSSLEIRYSNRRVKNPVFHRVHVENTGNVPILRADFDGPAVIQYEKTATILDVRLNKTTPANLPIEIEKKGAAIFIKPILMNPGDSFDVDTILSDSALEPKLLARVTGISNTILMKVNEGKSKKYVRAILVCLMLVLYSFFLMDFAGKTFPRPFVFAGLAPVEIGRGMSLVTAASTAVAAGVIYGEVENEFAIGQWTQLIVIFSCGFAGMIIASISRRSR